MTRTLIYGLVDPRTLLVRYVGRSSSGLRRPKDHGTPSLLLKDTTRKGRWIRALRAAGRDYVVVVLEEAPSKDELSDLERWWIAYGRACGWPLTNLTDGGEGLLGLTHKPETRAKISEAKKGHAVSAQTRAKLAAWRQGRKASAATRAKMSAKKVSPETRAKLSAWERTAEYGMKISSANKGRQLTSSAKLVAAWTPERRAAQSARLKAKWRARKCAI